jgi:putative oxidoreductase
MKTSTLTQQANLLGDGAMPKSLTQTALGLRSRALAILGGLDWLALVAGRLAVGLVFASTGWGKIHNIEKVTEFFVSLGIPAPGFHAVLVGYSELVCGSLLVIGLLSRFATVPLIVSMIVAIITAKGADIHGILDLAGQEEFTYLVVLFMVAILGPGRAAVDALIARRLDAAASP